MSRVSPTEFLPADNLYQLLESRRMTQQLPRRAQLRVHWTSCQPRWHNCSFHFHQISLIRTEDGFLFSHYLQGCHRGRCLLALRGDVENCTQDTSKQIILRKGQGSRLPQATEQAESTSTCLFLPLHSFSILLCHRWIALSISHRIQETNDNFFHPCITFPRPSYLKICYKEGSEEIIWKLKMVGT